MSVGTSNALPSTSSLGNGRLSSALSARAAACKGLTPMCGVAACAGLP